MLDGVVGCDDLDPVDYGWALVQRARIRTDLSDSDAARADAVEAQRILSGDRDDITVSALAASAAWCLYSTAAARRYHPDPTDSASDVDRATEQWEAFGDLVAAADTTVSWWRSQDIASGLSREQDTSFASWAEDDPTSYVGGSPMPEVKLFAAELNADITAEHSTWRALSARRAQQTLMRAASSPDEAGELVEGLDGLRRSGDSRHLTKAIQHLVTVGPMAPLAAAMDKLPVSGWTQTTALANFKSLAAAGDLIVETRADELIEQCARAACGDTTDLGCTAGEGYFSLPAYATSAAAGLLPSASSAMHAPFASHLARLPDVPPESFRRGLDQALAYLDYAQVGQADRRALRDLAERGHAQLRATVLGWFAAHGDASALGELKQAAIEGDIEALSAINSDTAFNDQEATALVATLEQRVQKTRSEALAGRWNSGSPDSSYALARCNLLFPNAARWGAVIDLFGESHAFIEDKRAICDAIAVLPGALPPETRDGLVPLIGAAATDFKAAWPGTEPGGMALRLKVTLGLVNRTNIEAAVVQLVFGTRQERRDASLVLREAPCVNRELLLNVLLRDTDFAVRYCAAETVGYLAGVERNDATVALARDLARRDGRQLPLALIRGISAATVAPSQMNIGILALLTEHASAAIRIQARQLQQPHLNSDIPQVVEESS